MFDILKQYDVIDTFDENSYQTVTMGIDNSSYQDIVIINKIRKSNYINDSFIAHYKKVADNVLAIESDDLEYLIINKYEQSMLLSDYISEETLDFPERIRLAKGFLYQLSFYEVFDFEMQQILVNADQLTISNGSLKFSDYVFMKTFEENIKEKDLHKIIASILELILELHREILTTELSALQSFLYQLLHDKIELSYNDIYNKFKVLASALTNDGINFTADFETPVETETIIEQAREARLIRERLNEETILVEDVLQEDETEVIYETISFEEESYNLPLADEQDEPIIQYNEQPFDSSIPTAEIGDDHTIEEDDISAEDMMDLFKQVELSDDTLEETEPPEIIEPHELIEKLVSEDEVLDLIKQVETFDTSDDSLNERTLSEPFDISDKQADSIIHEINTEHGEDNSLYNESQFEQDDSIFNDESKLEKDEPIFNDESELEIHEPFFDDELELEADLSSDLEKSLLDEPVNSENIIKKIHEPVPSLSDAHKTSYDERKHSVVLESNSNEDPIQDILNRNEKQHSDLYINQKKKKKKFLPTFLLFFIILILITSLLIFYTSKYM